MAILALILIFGIFYTRFKDKSNIDNQISLVDTYIDNNEYEKASKLLSKLSKKSPNRYSCYRILKRIINISEITNNFESFKEVAFNSTILYPGNEDIQAYYVMSLLKNKNYDIAFKVANDQLISTEFKPLLAQAVLFNDNANPETKSIVDYIESRKDPSFFEYLANLLDDKSLYINSALLWAKNGEIEKSYSIISNLKESKVEELTALISYDSGRESEALMRLLELPLSDSIKYENLLLIGDLFYLKENWARSRYYYEKAIELNSFDSTPFLNISSIFIKGDSIKKSIEFLEETVKKYNIKIDTYLNEIEDQKNTLLEQPNSEDKNIVKQLLDKNIKSLNTIQSSYKEVILLLYHLYKEIQSNKAIKILEDYNRIFPNDVKIELLNMRENNDSINPELFVAKLWKLLNLDVNSREVSEFLIWYLMGVRNYKDIELVLERNINRHPESEWTLYYKAILDGLNGNYTDSLKYFEKNSQDIEMWEFLYNKGVIQLALYNYSEALMLFNKSLIALNQKNFINNKDKYQSKIQTKIAQVLIRLNDIDEAIRVLNNAFELDPNNYTSDLLKSVNLNLKNSN